MGFLICGAQKAGTSALHAYLREHPDICMSKRKELHYFDQDRFFEQPKQDYSYYHKQFAPEPQHKIIGEATPSYMYCKRKGVSKRKRKEKGSDPYSDN